MESTPLLGKENKAVILHTIEGARFFATFAIVVGHVLNWQAVVSESVDETTKNVLDHIYFMFADLQKVVSFWFLLAGFTLTWSNINRGLEDSNERWSFWKRRFSRLYPDIFISSVIMFVLAVLFYCAVGWRYWLLNISTLTLLPGWIAGWLPMNGSMWFILAYAWLVIFFPFLHEPVKSVFRNDSVPMFLLKLGVLWFISLAPWVLLSAASFYGYGIDPFGNSAAWTLNTSPLMHLPELLIGMALAVKVHEDMEAASEESKSKVLIPLSACPYAVLASVLLFLVVFLWRVITWSPDRSRWLIDGMYNSILAPFHVVLIYGIVQIELSAKRADPKPSDAELGSWVLHFLTWQPLVEAASWGLPAFLFAKPVYILLSLAAQAAHMGSFTTTCIPSDYFGTRQVDTRMTYFNLLWFVVMLAADVAGAFLVGWLMSGSGPAGKLIHGWVDEAIKKI